VQAGLLEQREGLNQLQDVYEVIEEMQSIEAKEHKCTYKARMRDEQLKMKAATMTENTTAKLLWDDGKLYEGLSVHDRARRKRKRAEELANRNRKRVRWKECEMQQQQQISRQFKRMREERAAEARWPIKKAKLSPSDSCLNDDVDFVEPESLGQQPMSIDQSQQERDLCLAGSAREVFVASATQQTKLANQGLRSEEKTADQCLKATANQGLAPPRVASGKRVSGENKRQLRRENKAKRQKLQAEQDEAVTYWVQYTGNFEAPPEKKNPTEWRNSMCPRNLALHHPAAEKLLEYARGGCPCNTGQPWTKEMIHAAVERGPHVSALEPDAADQLHEELAQKERVGQCRIVLWDDIKNNPPQQMKVSPIAMIPHKSRKYRAILDLSFRLRLKDGGVIPSVNEKTTLEAPAGAIDQMGHALSRIIHMFAESEDDAKIFMAKFDIKDGFWRLDCEEGEERGTFVMYCRNEKASH
jgi:hypothetical protein